MAAQLPKPQTSISALYDQDFCLWLEQTALLLRQHRLTELDLPNLVEEIEAMGRSEKLALESNLEIVLMHLLKYQYQPERRSNSWRYTIREHRNRVRKALKVSPSLKPYLEEEFEECYQNARALATDETALPIDTFPPRSPFPLEAVLDPEFLPA